MLQLREHPDCGYSRQCDVSKILSSRLLLVLVPRLDPKNSKRTLRGARRLSSRSWALPRFMAWRADPTPQAGRFAAFDPTFHWGPSGSENSRYWLRGGGLARPAGEDRLSQPFRR